MLVNTRLPGRDRLRFIRDQLIPRRSPASAEIRFLDVRALRK